MPSSNPVIGHILHIFYTTAVSGILSPVPDLNMIHFHHSSRWLELEDTAPA